ncbi:hypothetical protein [Pelagibius sp.]|uniref:hypothetical protein n=1 Tax=Pelagibius sp. TaxID=1931238 RepID=UPI0026196817|nr:hypothetical protein [Pelagibius sp.]
MALSKSISLVLGAVLLVGLTACDEAEQGRILRYEKGTYLGPQDSKLSDETRDALRARTSLQGG